MQATISRNSSGFSMMFGDRLVQGLKRNRQGQRRHSRDAGNLSEGRSLPGAGESVCPPEAAWHMAQTSRARESPARGSPAS